MFVSRREKKNYAQTQSHLIIIIEIDFDDLL